MLTLYIERNLGTHARIMLIILPIMLHCSKSTYYVYSNAQYLPIMLQFLPYYGLTLYGYTGIIERMKSRKDTLTSQQNLCGSGSVHIIVIGQWLN